MSTPTTPAIKVHVIGPNLRGQSETFHVHAEGCADVQRSPLYRGPDYATDRTTTYDVASLQDLVTMIYDPSEFDYDPEEWIDYLADFKVFPCVPTLPGTTPDDTPDAPPASDTDMPWPLPDTVQVGYGPDLAPEPPAWPQVLDLEHLCPVCNGSTVVTVSGDAICSERGADHYREPVTSPTLCQWFALCTNPATITRPHPVLGDVPICDRCQAKIAGLEHPQPEPQPNRVESHLDVPPLVAIEQHGCVARIALYQGEYVLWWTDGVANDWEESYPALSLALARLAVLMRCGESDWERGFAESAFAFPTVAAEWLEQQAGFPDSEPPWSVTRVPASMAPHLEWSRLLEDLAKRYGADPGQVERVCSEIASDVMAYTIVAPEHWAHLCEQHDVDPYDLGVEHPSYLVPVDPDDRVAVVNAVDAWLRSGGASYDLERTYRVYLEAHPEVVDEWELPLIPDPPTFGTHSEPEGGE